MIQILTRRERKKRESEWNQEDGEGGRGEKKEGLKKVGREEEREGRMIQI